MASVNPYLSTYKELARELQHDTSKQIVMFVSEQAARMHNALGVVITDMIKALSTALKESPTAQRQPSDDESTVRLSHRVNQIRKSEGMTLGASPVIMQVLEEDDWTGKELFSRSSLPTKPSYPKPNHSRKRYSQFAEIDDQISNSRAVLQSTKSSVLTTAGSKAPRQSLTPNSADEQSYRVSCNMCQRFYQSIGQSYEEVCECTSRHRSSKPKLTRISDFDDQFQI